MPGWAAFGGVLVATAGYLLPWFRPDDGYEWWFSGLEYATLSSGGGWTLWVFVLLGLALVSSLWAAANPEGAIVSAAASFAAAFVAALVVAASFSSLPSSGAINSIAEIPFGVGIPVMGIGFGLAIAGAIAHTTAPAVDARLRLLERARG